MNLLTLTEIRRAAQNGAVSARVHVQVESATAETHARRKTVLRAGSGRRMRPDDAAGLERSSCLQNVQRIYHRRFHRAHWRVSLHSQYGLEADKWTVRPLTEQEKNELLQGPADLRAKQASDFEFIRQTVAEIS